MDAERRSTQKEDLTSAEAIYSHAAAGIAEMLAERNRQSASMGARADEPEDHEHGADSEADATAAAEEASGPGSNEMPTREAFEELVRQAHQDPEARQRLKAVFDAHPEIYEQVGDLARLAESRWISRVNGEGTAGHACITRFLDQMRTDLAGPSPTSLVELAVRRVVQCWIQLQVIDCEAATPGLSDKQRAFWSRQQDQAHRRYTSAVRSLKLAKEVAAVEAKVSQASCSTKTSAPSSSNGNGSVNGHSWGSDMPGLGSGTPLHRFARHLPPSVA